MNEIEELIFELNRLKIKKPGNDTEVTRILNSAQREIEEYEGISAVELDDEYNV